jgi:hypothetical protein
MKTYEITATEATSLLKLNAEYLVWLNGNKITKAELIDLFEIWVTDEGTMIVEHREEDFRIADVNLHVTKALINERTNVSARDFAPADFYAKIYNMQFRAECSNYEMTVTFENGAEVKLAGEVRENGNLQIKKRNGQVLYGYQQAILKKDFIAMVQDYLAGNI